MVIETNAQTRYHRLWQEAETSRLLKQIKASNLRPRDHIRSKLGDLLIAAGQKLKAAPVTSGMAVSN
jgi:hypothetical protein